MDLYAPEYYRNFICIADKCNHSCCVGWEIDIDAHTAKRYYDLKSGYGTAVKDSVDMHASPHFKLVEGQRCPHLDPNGLCRIISELGEEYLCNICREHPRFYNNVTYGKEVGIGLACEEACRLVLASDGYSNIVRIGEISDSYNVVEFDTVSRRNEIYSILSAGEVGYSDRLSRISAKYGVSLSCRSDEEWQDTIQSLEYINDEYRNMFSAFSSDPDTPKEYERVLERAFAYFVYRHCTSAECVEDFRLSVGLCLFCERLIASIIKGIPECSMTEVYRIARVVSEQIEYSEDNTDSIKQEFLFI